MKVLSLCDGISCGQIARAGLGIPVASYHASEIDKHAIAQTTLNFPATVQHGDIETWRDWNIDWSAIDLILAGTPCTGFSFAGKMLAFDDPQSRLFFCFADILDHVKRHNPEVLFLLENTRMKKEHLRVISERVGVFPVLIDSALVSAQTRRRYYWTNIRTKKQGLFSEMHVDIPQPADRGIILRDILESDVDEKYYVSDATLNRLYKALEKKVPYAPKICPEKTGTLTQRNNSSQMAFDTGTTFIPVHGKFPTQRASTGRCLDKDHNYQFIKINKQGDFKTNQHKASCFTAGAHSDGNHPDMDLILQIGRGKNNGGLHEDKSPTVSSNSWEQNNLVVQLNPSTESGGIQPYQQNRVYDINHKSPALMAQLNHGAHAVLDDAFLVRRLTLLECSRLQTIPAWYRWECSDKQAYRMLGNGWTIEVIMHILSYLPEKFKQINNNPNGN
jgi:DNA (cytosine-5)-methyltransferase 3A